jgi:hypothetical protein
MQIRKSIALAVTICLVSTGVFAQDVKDVIGKSLDAVGGKDKLAQLQSVYQEITISVMGNDLTGKIWIVNEKALRMEMAVMGSNIIIVTTKDSGWTVNPMSGSTDPQPLPAEQMKQYTQQMNLQGLLANYADHGYTATLIGSEKVDGKDNFKVKLSKSGEGDQVYYIDASTYLISKVSVTANVNGSDITSDIAFADYKKTPEGYTFPFTTTITTPQAEIKSIITKIVPNQAIDDSLFKRP